MATILQFVTKEAREADEHRDRDGRWVLAQHEINRERKLEDQREHTREVRPAEGVPRRSRSYGLPRPRHLASPPPATPAPDFGTFFNSVTAPYTEATPHPMFRVCQAALGALDAAGRGLRTALAVYLTLVSVVSVALLIANRQLSLAAFVSMAGLTFTWVLLERRFISPSTTVHST